MTHFSGMLSSKAGIKILIYFAHIKKITSVKH